MVTMPGGEGGFGSSISFRDYPESVNAIENYSQEADLDKSQVMRGFTELYKQDPHVRSLVHGFVNEDYDSLFDYCDTEIDALDEIADNIQREAEFYGSGLDPEEVDDTLAKFMEALYSEEQEQDEVREAVNDFGNLDSSLGSTAGWYAGRFTERYWEVD